MSLGTSDTVFAQVSEAFPSAVAGHIFCDPTTPNGFSPLNCYSNGSLAREEVRYQSATMHRIQRSTLICWCIPPRDRYCDGSWSKFNQLLESTPAGNNGNLAVVFGYAVASLCSTTLRRRAGSYVST